MAREAMILFSLLLDEPGDGGAGGGASAGAGTAGAVASGSGAAGAGASGASSGTSTPFKIEDDPRYKGTIADLQKERKSRQEFERKVAEIQAQADERQRQIEALTGVRRPSKEEADLDQVRERMIQLFPGLARLTDEQMAEKIDQILSQGEQLSQANQSYWTRHGSQMLDSVHKQIAEELGDLTDRQKKRINAAYVAEAEADPTFLARHDKGDPTLIREFVKNYLEDFVEPVKRKVTASEAGRFRPLPNGRDRSMPMNGDKPIDVKDDKAVMDMIVASRKGRFGR